MGAETEAGKVYINLEANTKKFQSQMNGLEKIATKLGGKIAAALGTAALVKFGKSCIDLASDLNEVQNVVDVTFPKMAAQADKFAKSAASMYGLSETMAKRYLGTFGSMAEAFGFSEKQAYQMSEALTGLAGDVASFYNISQDQAYTKLKSVFSGETESLKELGVVMTQAALDQFALANGFGKTTKAMTEQEKVSLRLAFVTNSLKNAAGDFSRTSDSWANSIKILQLRFESFKASIGQALIIAFTPVIRLINTLLLGITGLADKFVKFMSAVTGKSFGNAAGAAKQFSADMGNASASAADIGKTTKAAANNTNKAQKAAAKLKRALMGFDRINKLEKKEKKSDKPKGGGTGAGVGAGTGIDTASKSADDLQKNMKKITLPPALQKALDKLKTSFAKLVEAVKPAGKWLMDHILKPLGDWTVNKLAPKLVELLAAAIDVVTAALNALKPVWQWLWKNIFSKFYKMVGDMVISVLDGLILALKLLAKLINKLPGAFKKVIKILKDLASNIKKGLLKIIEKVKEKIDAFVKVWNGIKDRVVELVAEAKEKVEGALAALAGLWEGIQDRAAVLIAEAKEKVSGAISALKAAWEGIGNRFATLQAEAKEKVTGAIATLKTAWEGIKDRTTSLLAEAKEKVQGALSALAKTWNSIKEGTKNITTNAVENVKKKLSSAWESGKKAAADAFKAIKNGKAKKSLQAVWLKGSSAIVSTFNKIKNSNAVKTLKMKGASAVEKAKKTWDAFKSKAYTMKVTFHDAFTSAIKKAWNGIAKGINSAIKLINKIPGVNISKIPTLAHGGFVRKNTPQLAVIGDNRHEGEVVAPESKLLDMSAKAAALAGNNDNTEMIRLLQQILDVLMNMDTNVYIDGKQIKNRIVALINAETKATGRCAIYV